MTSDYGQRAAVALDQLLPGEHRDKIVARMFNVSLRMAKYLRAGQHWTADRLSQASALLGAAFDAALVSSDERHVSEMTEIAERLARLEEWRAETDRGGDAGLAPEASAAVEREGRAPPSEAGAGRQDG